MNGEAVDEAAVERGGGGAEDGAEGGTSAHVAADDEAAGRTRLDSDNLVEPDSARSRLESDELLEPDSADTFNENNRERRDSQASADGAVSDISSSNSTPPLLGQVTPQSTSDSLNGDFTFLHEGDTRTVSYLCQDGSNGQDGDVVLGSWKGDPMKVWRVDSMNAFGFRVGSEGRVTRVSLDYRKSRSKERPVPEDLSSLNDLKALDYLRIRGLPPLEQINLRLPSGEINPRQEFFPRDVSFLANLAKQNTLKELHLIDLIQVSQRGQRSHQRRHLTRCKQADLTHAMPADAMLHSTHQCNTLRTTRRLSYETSPVNPPPIISNLLPPTPLFSLDRTRRAVSTRRVHEPHESSHTPIVHDRQYGDRGDAGESDQPQLRTRKRNGLS